MVRNVTWLGVATMATKPLWFLFITAACMRVLDREAYGYLTVVMSLAFVASSFVDFGSERYTVRELVRNPSDGRSLVSQLLSLRVVLSLLSLVVCVIGAYFLGYRGFRLAGAVVASVYAIGFITIAYYRSIFQAFHDLRTEAITVAIEKVAVVTLGAAALIYFRTPVAVLAGMSLGMAGALAVTHYISSGRFIRASPSIDSLVRSTVPLRKMAVIGLTAMFNMVYLRIDQVMIGEMLGDLDAGLYGAAFRIVEASFFVPAIISTSALYPRLVWTSRYADRKAYRSTLGKGLAVLGLTGITAFVVLLLAADIILALLAASSDYDQAALPLRVLGASIPLLFLNNLLFSALIGFDDERWVAKGLFLMAALNIAGNAVLIPVAGVVGAAAVTVCCEIVLFTAYLWRLRRTLRLRAFGGDPRQNEPADVPTVPGDGHFDRTGN